MERAQLHRETPGPERCGVSHRYHFKAWVKLWCAGHEVPGSDGRAPGLSSVVRWQARNTVACHLLPITAAARPRFKQTHSKLRRYGWKGTEKSSWLHQLSSQRCSGGRLLEPEKAASEQEARIPAQPWKQELARP